MWLGLLKIVIAGVSKENFEWKVEAGDTLTLTYTKLIDKAKNNQEIREGTDEEGNKFNITLQKGSTVKYTIMSIKYAIVYGNIEMNGIIFARNTSLLEAVRQTTDNKTYWEEKYKDQEGYSIEGDHIVHELEGEYGSFHQKSITKWNWKTGWKTYNYFKSTNNSQVTREVELTTETGGLKSPGFELFPPIMAIVTTRGLVKRRKSRHQTELLLLEDLRS